MSLTDRDKKIAFLIIPMLAIVGYWFLLLAPKREEASKAGDEVAQQEQRLETARGRLAQASTAETDFSSDYSEIVRLGKAIPAKVDMPSLIVQLESAAQGTGIRFTKIGTGERMAAAPPATAGSPPPAGAGQSPGATPAQAGGQPAQSGPGTAAEAANNAAAASDQRSGASEQSGLEPGDAQTSASTSPGGLPVGGGAAGSPAAGGGVGSAPAGLETVAVDLEFVGDFFRLADFFHSVKRFVRVANSTVIVNGRLITIEGLRYTSDPQLFPRIKAELTATVYLSPLSQGVTAGATPQGPGGTTPAATTTPATPAPSDATAAPAPSPAPTAAATP